MTYLGRQGGKKGFWGLRCDVAENRFIRKKHLFFRCYNNYNIIHHSLMINRQNLHGKIMKGEILQIGHSLLLWHQQPLHNFGHFILKSSRCFLIESFDAQQDFSFCALQEAWKPRNGNFKSLPADIIGNTLVM